MYLHYIIIIIFYNTRPWICTSYSGNTTVQFHTFIRSKCFVLFYFPLIIIRLCLVCQKIANNLLRYVSNIVFRCIIIDYIANFYLSNIFLIIQIVTRNVLCVFFSVYERFFNRKFCSRNFAPIFVHSIIFSESVLDLVWCIGSVIF